MTGTELILLLIDKQVFVSEEHSISTEETNLLDTAKRNGFHQALSLRCRVRNWQESKGELWLEILRYLPGKEPMFPAQRDNLELQKIETIFFRNVDMGQILPYVNRGQSKRSTSSPSQRISPKIQRYLKTRDHRGFLLLKNRYWRKDFWFT